MTSSPLYAITFGGNPSLITSVLLLTEEASVRCAAAGVLVNVCGAGCGGEAAAVAARALLAAAHAHDAAPAALLARALWNAHAHRPLADHDAATATAALDMFIGEFLLCEPRRDLENPAGTQLNR